VFLSPSSPWPFFVDDGRSDEHNANHIRSLKGHFKWLRSDLFVPSLANDLLNDAQALMKVLKKSGEWHPTKDSKLQALLHGKAQ
jgi:hypothetical protein